MVSPSGLCAFVRKLSAIRKRFFKPLDTCDDGNNPAVNMIPYAELYKEGLPDCSYLAIYRINETPRSIM